MPQLGRMDKVVLYDKPVLSEKTAAIVDMQENYNTWYPSRNHIEIDKSDFYSEDDEKKILVPDFNDYFRRPPVNLEWRNISLKAPDGKKILDGLNGSTSSGKLTAIMGPSGAGKTSLLNVLTGFIQKRVTGRVLVNGTQRDMLTFRKLTCYILQDDCVMNRFTIRELITIASRLKLPTTVSEKERKKIVDDCIYSFGLDAHQNQKASTLSGGQRKRLCIAQEIVNNPPIIFLDEPTSGLDSSSCLQCMQLLKNLATEGRNIICTIHQPSSRIYEIFDNIYMISEGQCIYRGPTKNLIPFLEKQGLRCPKYHSPTDFITDVAIGLYGDWNWKLRNATDSADENKNRWCEIDNKVSDIYESKCCQPTNFLTLFRKKVKESTTEKWLDESFKGYATSFWNQFKVLFMRSYLDILRTPEVLLLKFGASIFVGLLFGSLYYNTGNDGSLIFNTSGFMFTLMIFIIVSSKVPTILTFPFERAVFERQHMNGWYSTTSYYLARTSASIPFQLLFPSITSAIVYWMSGQPPEFERFLYFLLSVVMTSLIAESLGFLLGAALSVESGVALGGILTSPLIVLSGVLLPITDIPAFMRWTSYLMFTKYSMASVMKILYSNRQRMECIVKTPCFFTDSSKFLKFRGFNSSFAEDFWAMLGFFIFFKIAGFIVLYLKATQRR